MGMDETDSAAIRSCHDRFAEAFASGDFAATAADFTEDAVILPPGPRNVTGRAAVAAFWRRVAERNRRVRFETDSLQPLGAGAMREIGTMRVSAKGPAGKGRDRTFKYLAIWRDSDGGWKIQTCIWNPADANRPTPKARRQARGGIHAADPAPYVPRIRSDDPSR